ISAGEFNRLSENHYRNQLRQRHLDEAFSLLIEDLRALELIEAHFDTDIRQALNYLLRGNSAAEFVAEMQEMITTDRANDAEIQMLINLMLLSIRHDLKVSERILNESDHTRPITSASSVC